MFSGGLDSLLAARLLALQGIDTQLLSFLNPFTPHLNTFSRRVRAAARRLQLPLRVEPIGDTYLDIIRNPEHGYGKNANPCVDCRIHQLRLAEQIMQETGASFLATGEVLGQRPMTQKRGAMQMIDKAAGVQGLVLRPLSAKLLDPTEPEINGVVEREKLLDISGRSRRRQIQLAAELGIDSYPTPAGGCLLTDPGFSARLTDVTHHGQLTANDIDLLKVGRHFRISEKTKIVIGRNHEENLRMRRLLRPADVFVEPVDFMGPDAIIRGDDSPDARHLACRLVVRYSKHPAGTCHVTPPDATSSNIYARAIAEDKCRSMLIPSA